jgi:hypothetical protein
VFDSVVEELEDDSHWKNCVENARNEIEVVAARYCEE